MNRKELAKELAAQLAVSQASALSTLDTVFNLIKDKVADGQEVELANFGIFKVKESKARTALNPNTGEEIQVPAKKVPTFKPFKSLRDAVN